MQKLSLSIRAMLFGALFAFGATSALGAGPGEDLKHAIGLFEQGEYLAAQESLAGIDRSQMTSEQQAQRDDYLKRTQVAITMYEKALRDLEDAETAIGDHDTAAARDLLDRVLANDYAAKPLKDAARSYLRDLDGDADTKAPARVEAVRAGLDDRNEQAQNGSDDDATQNARALTREGDDLTRTGQYDQAEQRYREALQSVPGFPEAAEGLNRVAQHRANASSSRSDSLAEQIRRRDSINWQRSVSLYRDAEGTVRGHVDSERYEDANQVLVRARQIVESGKQFADPYSKYEELSGELDELTEFVRSNERDYHVRKVAATRDEILRQREARIREIDAKRSMQVEVLMEEANQHRKDGDLTGAINVLKQVVVIDPKYSPARWMMDSLEDERHYRSAGETRKLYSKKTRDALQDVERAKIPWHEEVNYPDNWGEIINRNTRIRPGKSRVDRRLHSALDRPIRVDFDRMPFEDVIERLAESHNINVVPNWHDMVQAHVDRKAVIDLSLPQEITLRKAITEILAQAGGSRVPLEYEIADGVITIATKSFIDKNTYPKVYDVLDLLMEVPNYTDAPFPDLREVTRRAVRATDVGVRESNATPWKYGDDDDDESERDPERDSRVREIIDLIQGIVAPESWRANGGTVGTIKEINGQLVVTQNAASHRQITGLLDRLRQERAIQVSVEALFITVSSHYLEELGIDLDIVLNSGSAGLDFLTNGAGTAVDPVLGNRLLLPRSFSRLGTTPAVPNNIGNQLTTGGGNVAQPFTQAFLVPPASGGSGSQGTPVPVTSSVLDFTNPANLPSDIPGSFGGQAIGPALGVFGSFLDNIQVDFLIRATQADSRSSVVTAPRLVVFNGASAWIAVTIQQNFISQLQPVVAQGAVAQAPVTGTVDAGASLFVRATVTADRRYVMMLVAPGVTRLLDLQTFQFSGGTGANQAFVQLPTLSAQRVQTMVSVPDGGTLLIGGQKLASETEVEAGVPILSKIPVLKRLYSSRAMVKDEQVLLILIKPKILIQAEQEELAFPGFAQG